MEGNASALPLSPEARTLLRNLTGLRAEGGDSTQLLRLPSAYQFLPHLLLSPSSLRPALSVSRARSGGQSLCYFLQIAIDNNLYKSRLASNTKCRKLILRYM